MAQVTCSRCGASADAMAGQPFPGDVGVMILAQSCPACWKEWLGAQVRLINEYRLSPVNPEHYQFLIKEMKDFLKLRESAVDEGGTDR